LLNWIMLSLRTAVILGALPLMAASTTTGCADDTTWHKIGDTSKDCHWVAAFTARCDAKGYLGDDESSKVMGTEGCPEACGTCHDNPCEDAPLRDDFHDVPCIEAAVQSAADVTVGAVGLLEAALDPIPDYNAGGMCTVNVHWHLGAEHRSEGQYDEAGDFDHPDLEHRRLADEIRTGHMCHNAKEMWESGDELVATEYDWQYCSDMHVGLSYEIHWPHSNLGSCQTMWQYQYPFMDGVLCGATVGGLDYATAVNAINTGGAKIGVEGQVFTIVNSVDPTSSAYLRPTWDAMNGWDTTLATDVAYYQGSTTGDAANNDDNCRGTGGAVTWHVDRECHLLEAATMDNLCRQMLLLPADDLSADTHPHGARETVIPELADTPFSA